jgi:tryptophan-rich sensory protein
VGWIGALGTETGASPWYQSLRKPPWNPPSWVFAPVWTVLYVLMGIAAWLISGQAATAARRRVLLLFVLQLAANFAWTFIFFGAHRIGLALLDIALLWVLLAATLVTGSRLDARVGWLLAPYLGWVTFAASLNLSIWRLN